MSVAKVVEIWLADYDPQQFKTTTCVMRVKANGELEETTNKKALDETLDILEGMAAGIYLRGLLKPEKTQRRRRR